MAKDIDKISKKEGGARKQSSGTKRAKHRKISAASAERKRQAGMVRLSLWVPTCCAEDLRRFANSLQESRPTCSSADVRIEGPALGTKADFPAPPRRKRKAQSCDDRQLDLFGPQEASKVR